MTLPSAETNYQAPLDMDINRETWDHVMGSIAARLIALEGTEADYDAAVAQLQSQALSVITATITDEITAQRANLDALAADYVAFEATMNDVLTGNPLTVLTERVDAEIIARAEAFEALKPISYEDLSANTTLEVGGAYRLRAAGIDLTLPADPADGDSIYIVGGNVVDPTKVNILGNGKNIDGAASIAVGPSNADVLLWYDGSQWKAKYYEDALGVNVDAAGNSGAAITFSAAGGYNYHTVTLDQASTFTLDSGGRPSVQMYVEIENGGAFALSWGSTINWHGGVEPTLLASGKNLIGFITTDTGASWKGVPVWDES
ncbi:MULTISPECIES: hypothetical protein [unclassified Roseibium]|uniref:hypothetical protein n=1 Tax=unclassified Roseibium TaxID=2629323 RepID=UPI00273D72AE|nr:MULTISPECIES: hypothetical protein [unclassified Roseibium]